MKKLLIALFILLFSSIIESGDVKAQNLDSLYSVWQDQSQTDSNRVAAYYKYIWNGFLFSRPDTAEILADALHAYAKAQQHPMASAKGYNLQGIANDVQGSYPRALEYYQNSLAILEEIGDKYGIAINLNNIALTYNRQGNFPHALKYYQKSLAIFEKIRQPDGQVGDKYGIATNLSNIGIIYIDQGNYPRALEYCLKSLAIFEETGNKTGIANSLNNIGNIYKAQGNYPRALEYYHKSLAIEEETGNKNGIAYSLKNIGIIYNKQGNYPLALEYYQKSLAIHEEVGDKNGIASSLINIGVLYQKQRNHTIALYYCKKGLALSEIVALNQQQHACECLYNSYKNLGKDKEALKYFRQMIEVRDSLYNEENTKKLTRLEMQYDFDKKEAAAKAEQDKKDFIALQELKRQKLVRNGFIGGFAVVLLFAGVFFRQRNKIGKEKKRSEELLLNILPAEVAEELKTKGAAEAQLIEQVTVLFTDFKGFTALSEKMTPKELVADLHECFSAFDSICEKYGIEKIKTIGDAYMAAGGLPSPNTTHALDVVKASLEMAEVIEKGKATKIAAGQPFFEVRIGIHTGPVVAGIVGVKKFQYDIWGDTVNTASRMESSGAVGKVNISEATYDLLKNEPSFAFEIRGKIEAKGKGEIKMYFVSVNNE